MKYLLIRSQLVFVSVILFLTLAMTMVIVTRYNHRWDFTKDKIYSLSETTVRLLNKLRGDPIQAYIFYPQDDPSRYNFEVFLKEIQMHHPSFHYNFYDPDRVPNMAKEYEVKELYTVILRYRSQQERIVRPTEQSFTNALLRLVNPKKLVLCSVIGHGEASLTLQDRSGYSAFDRALHYHNYEAKEIILSRDKIPQDCQVVLIAGPHQELPPEEFKLIRRAFERGGAGILILIDPMDPGTGLAFKRFLLDFGLILGEDVVVDKMSRMVGGDFLVPLVSQYVTDHPVTDQFNQTTFFPVVRSIQPAMDPKPGLEVVPLALSSSGSWAETNLQALEKGEAVFEPETDLAGPLPIAVAVEQKKASVSQEASAGEIAPATGGRLLVIGDSDFLTNAYLHLSGNENFSLNIVQWLAKDDRFISIRPNQPEFQPLFMSSKQRLVMLSVILVGFPVFFLTTGSAWVIWRRKAL